MGEGLRRATLEALCSRGPWTVKSWKSTIHGVTNLEVRPDQVRALYDYIRAGHDSPTVAAGLGQRSDRTSDRALQLLRRARLIRFVAGRWEVCDG